MTYKIWYQEHKIFDIELWTASLYTDPDDYGVDVCYDTEIEPLLFPEGVSYYVFEKIKETNNLKKFITDTEEINDLRATLFEGYPYMEDNWINSPLESFEEAEDRMLHVHRPVFVKFMKRYCEKYNLYLSED